MEQRTGSVSVRVWVFLAVPGLESRCLCEQGSAAGAESPALPAEVGVLLTGSVSLIPPSQGELLGGCVKQSSQICESIPDSLPGAHRFLLKIEIGAMEAIFTPSSKGRVKAASVCKGLPGELPGPCSVLRNAQLSCSGSRGWQDSGCVTDPSARP